MKQFTINIGLHNNPLAIKETDKELLKQGKEYSEQQPLIYHLLWLAFGNADSNYRIDKGTWDGADEPTFVTSIKVDNMQDVYLKIERLCMVMTQISIPYSSIDESHLVYNPLHSFTDEELYKFNPEFFIKH